MRQGLDHRRGAWISGAWAGLFALSTALGGAARATEPPDETVPAAAPQGPGGTVAAGTAQPPVADGALPQFPFAGATIGDDVNVRAGPGSAYEIVTQLAGGERVSVVAESFGWLEVRPVRDVRVYLHKDLLVTKGAGVGVILKDRANLRSRGAPNATVVGQCARGDVVRLLDASGDWIALAAPPEAKLYVHKDLVRPVGAADGPAVAPPPPAPGSQAIGQPAPAPAPAAPSPVEKLKHGRDLYNAELEKPDIDAMNFGPAALLLEEARQEATIPEVRRAAEAALKRLRAAERVQADYRARVKPIGDLLEPPKPIQPVPASGR